MYHTSQEEDATLKNLYIIILEFHYFEFLNFFFFGIASSGLVI